MLSFPGSANAGCVSAFAGVMPARPERIGELAAGVLTIIAGEAAADDLTNSAGAKKGTHRHSRWFFTYACKALMPAAP